MPASIQWLHSPGRLHGEVAYLHHAGGINIVHLGSNDEDEVVISRAMEEECIQIILYPIQDTDGNCKWLLKVHADREHVLEAIQATPIAIALHEWRVVLTKVHVHSQGTD